MALAFRLVSIPHRVPNIRFNILYNYKPHLKVRSSSGDIGMYVRGMATQFAVLFWALIEIQ